jgi:hypothetical protein
MTQQVELHPPACQQRLHVPAATGAGDWIAGEQAALLKHRFNHALTPVSPSRVSACSSEAVRPIGIILSPRLSVKPGLQQNWP